MRRLIAFVMIATLLAATTAALAGKSKVGTTAFSFLKIGAGPRALAMGGAFAGLADDEAALYYNPAGAVNTARRLVSAWYMNYIADIQSGSLTAILPIRVIDTTDYELEGETPRPIAVSALGFSVNYLNYGSFDNTDVMGTLLGDFSGSDLALSVTWATLAAPRFSVGASGKFIYEKVDEFSATGLAADLGLMYRLSDDRTTFGLSASNLGFQLSGLSLEHKDPLPVLVRLGLAHRLRELPVTFSAEGVYPSDNDAYASLGLEVAPRNVPLALRAGYTSFGKNYKTGGSDNLAGFSFGAGFRHQKVGVDYAYLPYADLGSLHRAGLAYRW